MFTGIVEATATVLRFDGRVLALSKPNVFDDVRVGSSVCVAGVCLTITKFDQTFLQFDLVSETLERTTLGSLVPGSRVNLERALPASGRFDGHIVQGHVEGVARVLSFESSTGVLELQFPEDLSPYIVEKGSIAIDGVSLTVAKKTDHKSCSVSLIPETVARTTLATLRAGDHVNVETDILGRYVVQTVRSVA